MAMAARDGAGGWRAGLRRAVDLALVGLALTVAALPLVTAGAAVAAGSVAVHHHLDHDDLPGLGGLWRAFTRALLPGVAAGLVAAAVVALLGANAAPIAGAAVPGVGIASAGLDACTGALYRRTNVPQQPYEFSRSFAGFTG